MTDQSQDTSTSSNDTDNSSDLNIESQNEVRVEEGEALNENKGFKDFSDLAKNFKDFIEPDSAVSEMHVTSAEHTRASRAAEVLRERVEKTKTFIKDKKQKTTEVFNQKFDEETKEELKTLIEESKQIGKGFIGLIKKVIKK